MPGTVLSFRLGKAVIPSFMNTLNLVAPKTNSPQHFGTLRLSTRGASRAAGSRKVQQTRSTQGHRPAVHAVEWAAVGDFKHRKSGLPTVIARLVQLEKCSERRLRRLVLWLNLFNSLHTAHRHAMPQDSTTSMTPRK